MATHKKTKANAGETLVEVLVSIFLFLLMMGIMQGAISYSRAALEKNKQIRQENAEIIQKLNESTTQETGTQKNISFSAVNSSMTQMGNQVFTIPTTLVKKEITYQDTKGENQTTTFCLYQSVDTPSGENDGGENP